MTKDMLGQLVRKIVDFPAEMLGVICDLAEKLAGEAGHEWLVELKKFLRKEKYWMGVVKETLLKLISGDEAIVIDAANGIETLADEKDIFAYVDSDFKNYGANESGRATEETLVEVYEMAKNATFLQMFGELDSDVGKLCLTQHQIKNFVKKHRNWLRTDGYATFFLFESKGNFFVAFVRFYSDGKLKVYVFQFENDYVWDAEGRPRVVVLRLAVA